MVIWLTATPQTLVLRTLGSAGRPWLDDNAVDWMESTLVVRDPLYESVADHVVSTEHSSPTAVAAQILELIT